MRCPDTASSHTVRREGVTDSFHVVLNKVDPAVLNRCLNLLPKDNPRTTLSNEIKPARPQVPLVSKPSAFACRAERLARATPCPHWPIVRPSRKSERIAPSTDPREEVTLVEPVEVLGFNVLDITVIHHPRSYQPCTYQFD
jgi:hypothetical protein